MNIGKWENPELYQAAIIFQKGGNSKGVFSIIKKMTPNDQCRFALILMRALEIEKERENDPRRTR